MNVSPLFLASLAFASPAVAQSRAATDLDEVVVTATRTATTVDETLAPLEVIDREEITRSQARSLQELLRGRAGISMSTQGGAGKLSTLFMRGAESDHVVVLVDGVRVGSPTSGLVSFQDLPVELIERVEIVRGPRSALYGSEAIGGVIQVFTRRPRGATSLHASAGVGSHGQASGTAGIGAGSETAWFGVDAAYRSDEGIDACRVATPSPFSGGCFIVVPQPDRDGYSNKSLSARAGGHLGDALQVDLHALHAEGRNAYDGDFGNLSKVRQQVLGASATWTGVEGLEVRAAVGRNTDASDTWQVTGRTRVPMGRFATDRDSASVQADWTVSGDHLLTLGLDWLGDTVDSDTMYARTSRDTRAAFAQYQGDFGAHALQLAVRGEDDGQFGRHTTGNAAWGLSFAGHWRITAGYGTAFKAPTFNELYYPFFGNPSLRPETSRSTDAGLRFDGARADVRFDVFHTRADDLIAYDVALGLPANIERARMQGAELTLEMSLSGWDLDASASWLDTEQLAGSNAGRDLPRRADHAVRIDLDRDFGDFSLGLTGLAEGDRYDDAANTRRLPGHALVDLRAGYRLAPAWTLQARVANVFDREYETVSFYRQPGREWLLTLRWSPRP
ncbi:MAG TPA: TonB-dependent vitamin B12 receptor [Xanthomonadaceae bacterium]|nr:TonB-dependent vitamin B12 receptor [Xanthomonadaceae bacterium]